MPNTLIHLAVVFDGLEEAAAQEGLSRAAAVTMLLKRLGTLGRQSFEDFPDLRSLSLFSPELQQWILQSDRGEDTYAASREGIRCSWPSSRPL